MHTNAPSDFSDLDQAIFAYLASGLSLVPIEKGSKHPAGLFLPQEQDANGDHKSTWIPYQQRLPTDQEIKWWLTGGIKTFAVVCGSISGGLLILDFEFEDYFQQWRQAVDELADTLPIQRTGDGGYHVAFRCPQPGPSQKLAWKPDEKSSEERVIAIETRGEGSLAIVAPSLHPSGNLYQMLQGDFAHIPHITQAVANVLVQAARDLDQAPLSRQQKERLDQQTQARDHQRQRQTDHPSVIDEYNQRVSIEDALLHYGYRAVGKRFARPDGTSPSVYIDTVNNRSYHHSTNDLLSDGYWQKPFDVFCHYKYNGDIKAAVQAAAQELGLDKAFSFTHPLLPLATPAISAIAETYPHLPVDGDLTTYLLTEGADDEGNAQCTNRLYGHRFVYTNAYGWLHHDGHYWQMSNAEDTLDRKIVDTLKIRRSTAVAAGLNAEPIVRATKPSSRHVRDCKYLFRSIATVAVDEFDSDPDLLNCRNGVLNLRTGQLLTHEPSQRFTYCIPIAYDPHADMSPWLNFLTGILKPGTDMDNYICQAVGYSLTGHTNEEVLFYLYGPTRSGKGTFTETLLALLNKPLAVEADFSTFTARREGDSSNFDLAPLKPCRFVAASESNQYERLNAGVVKSLTGGNYIYCAFKHKTHFSYRPQYKIWLSSNHSVNADVDDEALWYRLRVIEFPNSFAGQEDKNLKQRLKQPEVLQGVLAWAVRGAQQWYHSKTGLLTPPTVKQSTCKQRDELDHLQQWLAECCEEVEEYWTANHLLYQSYENWCEANGATPKKQRQFGRALSHKGFLVGQKQRLLGKEFRGVVGLKILTSLPY